LRYGSIFNVIILGLGLLITAPFPALGVGSEAQILEAIRNGTVKVTDEMIEAQRKLHPELDTLSNQEVRKRLEDKAWNTKPADTAVEPPAELPVKLPVKPPVKPLRPEAPDAVNFQAQPDTETSRFPAGLNRFGYDFFSNNSNAGLAGGSVPALPEYILAPGDEIQIYTWGRENQTQKGVIDNEGMFHFPPLQPIRLAGLRFADAQQLLTSEIQKINGIKASVGLGKLKSIRVFVLGEAINPGSYVVSAGATVTSALFQSGGIKSIGSLRGIQLKRNGRVISTLDLYEMLLKGNNRPDQQLLPGDVIFVPVASIQAAVTGMVKRPGIYEVKPGTKVSEVLELAGGLTSNAFKGRVRLDRIENHKRKVVLDVAMEKMGTANVTLLDGDMLHVETVLSREYDVVYLEGNVNRPGRYEYKKGMNIRDLIPGVKDLKTETFFAYGHIKRASEDEQAQSLLPFSLKDVFENGVNVPLMPRDTVIVYSKFDIMDQPEVKIAGIIRKPGRYPFVEKMRISDLIIAGGGLTSDAYLPEAHLIRLLKIQESDSLFSNLLKVNLANLIDNPGDKNNLELMTSDSLIIFPRSNFILPKSVSISGSVKKPGDFELTQNMGIPELISQSDGFAKNTYKLKVEVVRKVIEKDSVVRREIHRLNLREIIDGTQTFVLQDGDAVYIREVVDNQGKIVVTLGGEFNFPGRYEVGDEEKLSAVIRRAGGFTRNAYTRGAIFIRESIKQRQIRNLEEIDRRLNDQIGNMLAQTTSEKDRASIQQAKISRTSMLEDIKRSPNLGRVVVNVDSDLAFTGSDDDLTLENGDDIRVGRFPNIISIMGEVFSPTNVVFGSENNSIGECLDKAGGVTEYGDAGNIYYIRPDGAIITPKNTSFFRWKSVEPGGTIVVPPKAPKKDYLESLAKITQIIYQIAISVGVAKTLF
jgi:polysaccharide biosynthesis/export protein